MIDSDSPTPVLDKPEVTDIAGLALIDPKEVASRPDFQAWAGEGWQDRTDILTGDDGEPLVFYHGGDSRITEFSIHQTPNTSEKQRGIYFTSQINNAKFYADKLKISQADRRLPEQSSVYAVALKMNNPFVMHEGKGFSYETTDVPEGYDGVINTKTQEAVVYDPSQIYIVGEANR